MLVNVTITRVPMTRPRFTRTDGRSIRAIVIHSTAGSYPGDFNWLKQGGGDDPVSVHYYIQKNGWVCQFVEDKDIAWHAGASTWIVDGKQINYNIGLNPMSIGIELENLNTGRDPYPPEQGTSLLHLVRELVKKYTIPRNQLVRHLDIAPGRKTDPAGFDWEPFVESVYKEEKKIQVRVLECVPVTEDWNPRSPVANDGRLILVKDEIVNVDEEKVVGTRRRYHLEDGRGFIDVDKTVTLSEISISGTQTILHGPHLSFSHVVSILNARGIKGQDADDIACAYCSFGRWTTIGSLIPLAQAIKETGWFTSNRWKRSYNAAGLGATDDGSWGNTFENPYRGIGAQYAHLLCYATENPQSIPEATLALASPRRDALMKTYGLGSAPRWIDLSGKWATDLNYGQSILTIARELL